MANLQYATDIKSYVLDKADEVTTGGSDFDSVAEELINRQYMAISLGGQELDPQIQEDWFWLRKDPPGTLVINPSIATGTVAVTNNNTGITFSSAPTASMTGRLFRVDGHEDVFRIAAHTGGAAGAILDTVYTGTTDATASYTLMQVEYDLASDMLKLFSPMRVDRQNNNDDPYKVYGMDLDVLLREWPTRLLEQGVPDSFAVVAQSSTAWTIRFNRYGLDTATELIRVEYDYLQRPTMLSQWASTETEEPLIPWEWRSVLADAALFLLMLLKNDDRADTYGLSARNGLRAMAQENRQKRGTMSPDVGWIFPRAGFRRVVGRVLRTESGLIIG